MISIVRANENDIQTLVDLGKTSFIESHGTSASSDEINKYVSKNYIYPVLMDEIRDSQNIYHIIYRNSQPAGYSKIIFNSAIPDISINQVTKLDRLYLLNEFLGVKLGIELFKFNLELSKLNQQNGMWLYVWKENSRALDFYKRLNFANIGTYDFHLSESHSNPNYLMLLKY